MMPRPPLPLHSRHNVLLAGRGLRRELPSFLPGVALVSVSAVGQARGGSKASMRPRQLLGLERLSQIVGCT